MRTPVGLLALQQFDKRLPALQKAAHVLSQQTPKEGWVRALRRSLGMSMEAMSKRLGFSNHSSLYELERNEHSGAITLQTLRRAAAAMDADFVYAIIPRKPLREVIRARAQELAQQQMAPIAKTMALEDQSLTKGQLKQQVEELAVELESNPRKLWHR